MRQKRERNAEGGKVKEKGITRRRKGVKDKRRKRCRNRENKGEREKAKEDLQEI